MGMEMHGRRPVFQVSFGPLQFFYYYEETQKKKGGGDKKKETDYVASSGIFYSLKNYEFFLKVKNKRFKVCGFDGMFFTRYTGN